MAPELHHRPQSRLELITPSADTGKIHRKGHQRRCFASSLLMNRRSEMEGRWEPNYNRDALPKRPARRTSIDGGRSVGRWRSDGDISALIPPILPPRPRGSPQRGPRNLSRWISESNVIRCDSLPFQPGRRDSGFSTESIDSSLFGCESSLASSALNSRCSNVSVSSMGAPKFVAVPVPRLHSGRPEIPRAVSGSHQSTTGSSLADDGDHKATTKLFLKLGTEAARNRKLSRSRSNQSATQKISRKATESHRSGDCVTLPDDWMKEERGSGYLSVSEDDTKGSDLFAYMEYQAEERLKQIIAGDASGGSSPTNPTAKVA